MKAPDKNREYLSEQSRQALALDLKERIRICGPLTISYEVATEWFEDRVEFERWAKQYGMNFRFDSSNWNVILS